MREIGAFEAKTHLSRLLDQVNRDKEGIWITRRGVRVACLIPGEKAEGLGAVKVVEGLRDVREKQAQAPKVPAKEWIVDGRKR